MHIGPFYITSGACMPPRPLFSSPRFPDAPRRLRPLTGLFFLLACIVLSAAGLVSYPLASGLSDSASSAGAAKAPVPPFARAEDKDGPRLASSAAQEDPAGENPAGPDSAGPDSAGPDSARPDSAGNDTAERASSSLFAMQLAMIGGLTLPGQTDNRQASALAVNQKFPPLPELLPDLIARSVLQVRASGLREEERPALDPAWEPLLDRLMADGFMESELRSLFARLGPASYSPAYMAAKITELYGVGGIGVNREGAPLPEPPENFAQPVQDITVGSCLAFMREHEELFALAEQRHGVPRTVILAILLIETELGTNLGNDIALRTLAGMAATTTPELLGSSGNSRQKARVSASRLTATLQQKSDWAYNELKALLRYAQDNGYDAAKLPCSIYGAIGLCQFMPSNISLFAVDGDADGKIDLFSLPDAVFSVANYLEANGWRGASSASRKQAVIYTYNHDNYYASSVLATSNHLERALKGKVSPQRIALVGGAGGGRNPSARLDPSLRASRAVPRGARIQSLGDYGSLLQ